MKKYRRIIRYQLIIMAVVLMNYHARPYIAIGGEFLLLPIVMIGEHILKTKKTN